MKNISITIFTLISFFFISCQQSASKKVSKSTAKITSTSNTKTNSDGPVMTFDRVSHDFGTIKEGSATEITRFNPSSPYAATKASAELLINSYVITYKIDAMITRCTNNYGPRQFFEKLIPKAISLSTNDKTIPIYGNGKSIRDWIFVNDH